MNKINDVVPIPKGWIKIWGIDKGNKRILLEDRSNALVENARKIIAHSLAGDSQYFIDTIEVYKAAALLATSPGLTISYPAGDKTVKFITRFDEASFNDTLDEVKLISSTGGIFSEVSGLSVLKDNTLKLEIEWILTINNI